MYRSAKIKFAARALAVLALVLLSQAATKAQCTYTLVSATITDPSGLPYANATITYSLTPAVSQPICNGQLFNGNAQYVYTNAVGFFSISLPSNSAISPGSTQWQFSVQGTSGLPRPVGTGTQQFTIAPQTLAGTPLNLSSTFSAAAPALTALGQSFSTANLSVATGSLNQPILNTQNGSTLSPSLNFVVPPISLSAITSITDSAGTETMVCPGTNNCGLFNGETFTLGYSSVPGTGVLPVPCTAKFYTVSGLSGSNGVTFPDGGAACNAPSGSGPYGSASAPLIGQQVQSVNFLNAVAPSQLLQVFVGGDGVFQMCSVDTLLVRNNTCMTIDSQGTFTAGGRLGGGITTDASGLGTCIGGSVGLNGATCNPTGGVPAGITFNNSGQPTEMDGGQINNATGCGIPIVVDSRNTTLSTSLTAFTIHTTRASGCDGGGLYVLNVNAQGTTTAAGATLAISISYPSSISGNPSMTQTCSGGTQSIATNTSVVTCAPFVFRTTASSNIAVTATVAGGGTYNFQSALVAY